MLKKVVVVSEMSTMLGSTIPDSKTYTDVEIDNTEDGLLIIRNKDHVVAVFRKWRYWTEE